MENKTRLKRFHNENEHRVIRRVLRRTIEGNSYNETESGFAISPFPSAYAYVLTDNLVVLVSDGHGQQRVDAGVDDPVAALVLVDVQHFAGTSDPLGQAFQIPRHVFAFDLLPGTAVHADYVHASRRRRGRDPVDLKICGADIARGSLTRRRFSFDSYMFRRYACLRFPRRVKSYMQDVFLHLT